jgi:hypothetical protein
MHEHDWIGQTIGDALSDDELGQVAGGQGNPIENPPGSPG